MKRWAVVLAIPAALLLLGAIAVKLYFTEERLKALLIPAVESATGRTAEAESVSLSFLPSIGISATGFRLHNPPRADFPSPAFISLHSLFVNVRLLPLFRGELVIDDLRLDRPVIHLDVLADGTRNSSLGGGAAAAGDAAAGDRGSAAAAFLLSNMTITGGRIESHNRRHDTRWIVDGLDHTLRVVPVPEGGALLVEGQGEIGGFSYGTGDSWYLEGIPLAVSERLAYRFADDRLEFTEMSVRLRDIPLAVSGSVSDLTQDVLTMDLSVDAPGLTVDRLLSLLPAAMRRTAGDVRADGAASFTMRVSGPSGDEVNPAVRASFRVTGGSIHYTSLPGVITGVAVDGALEMPSAPVGATGIGELDVSRFSAMFGSNSLTGTLKVSGFGDPSVRAVLRGEFALDELASYYPVAEGARIAGRVSSDVSLQGKPSVPATIRASGRVSFRNVSWSAPGAARPIRNVTGDLIFDDRSLDLKRLSLAVGESDLRLDATLRNYLSLLLPAGGGTTPARPFLAFDLTSTRLNTADISAAPDTAAGGAAGAGGGGGAFLPGIDMAGSVAIETLRTEKFTFTAASGSLSVSDGVAGLKNMKMDAFGGVVRADGTIDLAKSGGRPFDLSLDVRGVESNRLLSPFTRFGRHLFGTLTLATRLRGDLDDTLGIAPSTLAGDGSAAVADGKLTGVPLLQKLSVFLSADRLREVEFREWSQQFSIADGRLLVKELTIGGRDADITVSGEHGLDGTMDYAMRLRLPPGVSEGVRLEGVGEELLGFFRDTEGRLTLDFLVSGDVGSPVLKLDTRAQEEMLKRKLGEEAAKKLGDPLRKAAEGLRKLIKPKP